MIEAVKEGMITISYQTAYITKKDRNNKKNQKEKYNHWNEKFTTGAQ